MKMKNNEVSTLEILIGTHVGLKRQGPGSPEMTRKALSFLDSLDTISKVADLGCGTGGQTMVLARSIAGKIVGVDLSLDFIDVLNRNARELNFEERVSGIVGSMEHLPFQKEEFDLIWSEGAIDAIGFETGLAYWNTFLKTDGFIAVTCPSWLTAKRPAEVQKLWTDASSGLDSIEHNIAVMQKSGYSFIAAFTLPEECWTDNYYNPREAEEKAFLERYPKSKTVGEYIENSKQERELYSKYKQHYGYVFYIGKKM